jgi:deoxycytidine triphosphate deaminase
MTLSAEGIRERGVIQNATSASFRATTYDVLVDTIYVPPDGPDKGHENVTSYRIPPRGIVLLFSAETIKLPADLCAQAPPKTTLCEDGVYILNTEVIDPLYDGPISGMAINFGSRPYLIKQGDAFLRLLFEDVRDPPGRVRRPARRQSASRRQAVRSHARSNRNARAPRR